MKIIKGNIFASKCQTIVNTINCVGVMGAGIAYEFRLRYPEMFDRYVELCNQKMIKIGTLWIYKGEDKWILNFPTKFDWKYPSKPEYLIQGLEKFLDTYIEKGIESIAFPVLGASHGGIPEQQSLEIMTKYLGQCNIPVEIYKYDPYATDDLYIQFKQLWTSTNEVELSKKSGLRIDFVRKVKEALYNENINSLNRLLSAKGIGDKTLEKAFRFALSYESSEPKLDF
jgi:O-acetyl-ADP-ribose deacetylase (regulator of RNase III)